MKEFVTRSEEETKKIAARILETVTRRPLVIGLIGDLGAGKTSLVKGLAEMLGVDYEVVSPTFTLVKNYPITNSKFTRFFGTLFHLDVYRLKEIEEVINIGFEEIVSDPENVVIVEWADKIKEIMPSPTTYVTFEFVDKDANLRKIVVSE